MPCATFTMTADVLLPGSRGSLATVLLLSGAEAGLEWQVRRDHLSAPGFVLE